MNGGFGLRDTFVEIFRNLGTLAGELIPRLLTAIVVLLVGIIVAKIVERVLRTTLFRLQVDKLLEKVGVTKTLRGFGIAGSLGESAARLVYYLLVILFLRGAANSAGFVIISEAIASFFSYLPNLVAAFLVIMFGNIVAQFAGGAIEQSSRDSGVEYAPALGRAVSGGILFVVTIMAITQLGIDTAMIRTVAIIGLSAAGIGMALSFGIGTREITKNILSGFYVRKTFRVGEVLEVGETKGVLTAVTPTQTLLEDEGRTIAVANSVILEETARQ